MAETAKRKMIMDHGGPVIIWDPPGPEALPAGEERRGFLLNAAFCTNSECRWVRIVAVSVEDGDNEAAWDEAEYARSRIVVSLHLDTGELIVPAESEECPREPDLERRLRELLGPEGGPIREVLERRWRQIHGVNRDAWRQKDWSSWQPGVMVPWVDIHPDDPIFLFESDGDEFWAEDLYCVTPGCSCRNAMIFLHRITEKEGLDAGAFKVDLRRWRASGHEDAAPLSPREQQLWENWNRCDPGLRKEMNRRRKEMLRFGPEIAKLATRGSAPTVEKRTERKVGRNDPCPCGSGRKYKNCCMDQ